MRGCSRKLWMTHCIMDGYIFIARNLKHKGLKMKVFNTVRAESLQS